jgi:hypothetical protein
MCSREKHVGIAVRFGRLRRPRPRIRSPSFSDLGEIPDVESETARREEEEKTDGSEAR